MDTENQSDNQPSAYNKIYSLFLAGFIISLIFIVFFLHAYPKKNLTTVSKGENSKTTFIPKAEE